MNLIEHTSDTCPVALDALVLVDLGDGVPFAAPADELSWGPGLGPKGEGRILRYSVIIPGETHQ